VAGQASLRSVVQQAYQDSEIKHIPQMALHVGR
jgi:hypothetical protein